MSFRIGHGFDVHRLVSGRKFILGGIEIPHGVGPLGHSDGDALIHAICDALLGAANLRDIGFHFPDTSEKYKNIDSKILLKKTKEILSQNQYQIGNVDSTICLQKPKLKEYMPQMQKMLANVLEIPAENISIKATTTEKLGYIGREEGIAVHAVALVRKI
jgi:2-C-methyl-D-erythritol 2,4-cyclodiphosphate synthase